MNSKLANGNPWNNTATHATAATFTVAAAAGKTHYCGAVQASSDKSGAILTITDGSTTLFQVQVNAGNFQVKFDIPIPSGVGNGLVFAIDGTSACKVNAQGVTIG